MLSLVKSDINGVVSLCRPLEIPIEHLPFSLRRPGILGKRHPVRFYECLEMNRFLSLGAQCHQLIHDCLEDSNSIVIKYKGGKIFLYIIKSKHVIKLSIQDTC